MHRNVAGALVVALALALASCGGSSSNAPSKRDFASQGNAACLNARKVSEKSRGKGITAFAERVIEYQERKLKGIEALTPPDNLKARYTAYRAVMTQRTGLIRRLVAELKARHRINRPDEKTVAKLQTKEDAEAYALGLAKCSEIQRTTSH